MSYQNSPGFNQDLSQSDQEVESDGTGGNGRGRTWIVIAILVLVLLALVVVNYSDNRIFTSIRATGGVSGIVVDENGNGVLAEIMVIGTDVSVLSEETGRFVINDIPEGERILVVGYDATGWQYPVTILAGQVIELGEFSVVTTDTP